MFHLFERPMMFNESDGEAWKDPEFAAHPKPLSPDEYTLPEGTDELNPLAIWVRKEVLLEAIRESLESISRYRTSMDRNLDDVEHSDELIIQRRQFREWLESHPLSHVYVSMVPACPWENGDDDG
jgi:hypothetical protein